MTRRLLSNVALICFLVAAVGLSVYSVKAGPLSGAKDSARESSEAAEQAHEAARKGAGIDADQRDASAEAVDAELDAMEERAGDAGGIEVGESDQAEHRMLVKKAVVDLDPTEGNQAHGTVTLTQQEDSVLVEATVMGLEPNSTHGIHVHQYGDVTSPDGKAAGGHYDPRGHAHALADTVDGHAGDFGNLEADAQGKATFRFVAEGITIAGMKNPVLGRAIIVHEKADDGGQPTGNAGARIAQGVIGIAE